LILTMVRKSQKQTLLLERNEEASRG
jgi:hypothetical protein